MSEGTDTAVYQARLVEIFKSCDSDNKGYLSVLELERLCRQLHLQAHKQRLYKDLGLNKTVGNTKVYFEEFQSTLLSLLQEVGPDALTGRDQDQTSTSDRSAKRIKGTEDDVDSNNDLRLNLPPDMTEDDDDDASFVLCPEDPHPRSKASSLSPLKRAFMEMSACKVALEQLTVATQSVG